MRMAMAYLLVLAAGGLCLVGSADGSRREFTAAVYEHAVISAAGPCINRSEALGVIYQNLAMYRVATEAASKQGADIIVFPEYGITGLLRVPSRAAAYLFFETVSDPSVAPSCPCQDPAVEGSEVQHFLSCLAKNNSMYVVANMGDTQTCDKAIRPCPDSGYYLFNTNVAYGPNGCLVARYHKQHLFLAEAFVIDTPPSVEHSVFDTDFGRFGTFTCFDAVFESPAIDLVEQYEVGNIVFPTAWMNVLPHYSAIAFHSGWARGMSVNYLAANIHQPQSRMVGSGIYSPTGPVRYTYNVSTTNGVLVVATLPVLKGSSTAGPVNGNHTQQLQMDVPHRPASVPRTFESEVFGDLFTFVPLTKRIGSAMVCQKTVCCQLEYERTDDLGDLVALGAFDGMHTLEGTYYLEVCIVVRCADSDDYSTCGSPTNVSSATFTSFKFTSMTSTMFTFPEVLTLDNELAVGEWQFSRGTCSLRDGECYQSTIVGAFIKPLISSTHFGRNYARDGSRLRHSHPYLPYAVAASNLKGGCFVWLILCSAMTISMA